MKLKMSFGIKSVKRKIENSVRVLEMTSKEEFPISKPKSNILMKLLMEI